MRKAVAFVLGLFGAVVLGAFIGLGATHVNIGERIGAVAGGCLFLACIMWPRG